MRGYTSLRSSVDKYDSEYYREHPRMVELSRALDEQAMRDAEDWARVKAEGEAAERRCCRAACRPFDRARWLADFCRCNAGKHPGAPRTV
ncbi:MAG: hypothetical protein WD795_17030 [Woeseia sp.]